MTHQIAVEEAAAADVDDVALLEERCLGWDAWSTDLVREVVVGQAASTCLVARRGGDVVGYAITSYAGDIVDLQRIAVDPAHRRQGIAAALLAEVVARASRSGADRLLLEVREDNGAALGFYAAQGFTEVDRRRTYYRDGATAVVLRLPLGRGCGGSVEPGAVGENGQR